MTPLPKVANVTAFLELTKTYPNRTQDQWSDCFDESGLATPSTNTDDETQKKWPCSFIFRNAKTPKRPSPLEEVDRYAISCKWKDHVRTQFLDFLFSTDPKREPSESRYFHFRAPPPNFPISSQTSKACPPTFQFFDFKTPDLPNLFHLPCFKTFFEGLDKATKQNPKFYPTVSACFTALGLSKLPSSFHHLNPTELSLSHNAFIKVPGAIARFKFLVKLNLSYNKLGSRVGLDQTHPLRALTRLRELDLSHNRLYRIPLELLHLPKLEVLRLDHNEMEVHPRGAAALTSLKELHTLRLDHNRLGTIPGMEKLKKLRVLTFSHNVAAMCYEDPKQIPPQLARHSAFRRQMEQPHSAYPKATKRGAPRNLEKKSNKNKERPSSTKRLRFDLTDTSEKTD